MPAALRVAALCASAQALQMTSRRRCLHGLGGVTIASGGVLPNIHATLLPKKSASKK